MYLIIFYLKLLFFLTIFKKYNKYKKNKYNYYVSKNYNLI